MRRRNVLIMHERMSSFYFAIILIEGCEIMLKPIILS